MKKILWLMLCLLIPIAQAESAPPDHYTTHNVNIVGIIPAGSQSWYIYYPTEIDAFGTYQLTITVDSSAAASTTLTVVPAGTTAVGCTVGAIVVTHSSSSNVAARIPVTVSEDSCHITMTVNFQTAGGTVLSGIAFGAQIQMHDLEVDWTDVSPDAKTEFRDAISIFLPLLFFVLIVIWAELKKEGFLYLFAVIFGSILIPLLWADIAASLRTLLVMVIAFMALRLYNTTGDDE